VGRGARKYGVVLWETRRTLALRTAELLHDFSVLQGRDPEEQELRHRFFLALTEFLWEQDYLREAMISHRCTVGLRPESQQVGAILRGALFSLHEQACRKTGLEPMKCRGGGYFRWLEQEFSKGLIEKDLKKEIALFAKGSGRLANGIKGKVYIRR
jgi:hypothetical protein